MSKGAYWIAKRKADRQHADRRRQTNGRAGYESGQGAKADMKAETDPKRGRDRGNGDPQI